MTHESSKVWDALKPVFEAIGGAERIENKVNLGTPDVNWCCKDDHASGWAELKWAADWPVKGGPLRLDHYTGEQRVWHVTHWRKGWYVHVILRVADEWFVLGGEWAARYLGHVCRDDIVKAAILHTNCKPTPEALKRALVTRNF